MASYLTVSELARAAGTKAETVRFYEAAGAGPHGRAMRLRHGCGVPDHRGTVAAASGGQLTSIDSELSTVAPRLGGQDMETQKRKAHWDGVYGSKGETEVSWFQETAATSLDFLNAGALPKSSAIIDIGGGVSRLVDTLIERGYSDITVLDVSETALRNARQRLGAKAGRVRWIQADIVTWEPPVLYDVWHDRAVLHFLTEEEERKGYVRALRAGLALNGIAIIATFAPDGPEKCSGLPVRRYSPDSLASLLGGEFRLIAHRLETHKTPWGADQAFQFSLFRRVGDRRAGG